MLLPLSPLSRVGTDQADAEAPPPPTCGGPGLPSVNAVHDPNFYIDTSLTPKLLSNYAGYSISSSTVLRGYYLGIGSFTGGVISLAGGQSTTQLVSTILPGQQDTVYKLLTATGITTTPQSHVVTLYNGDPAAGGTAVCQTPFTYLRAHDTIKALANKVTGVTTSQPVGAFAQIGEAVDVVVTGFTGTLGAGPAFDPGVLAYTPTVFPDFPAGAWQLELVNLTISPDGVAPQTVITDDLYLTGASGPNRPYTVTYRFRAMAAYPSSATVTPVQYIASGTQVKHTNVTGTGTLALPPIGTAGNVVLAKSVAPTVVNSTGGIVTYTVTATNSGDFDVPLDRLVDTLPPNQTYQVGTSKTNGGAIPDPSISGQVLTWPGRFFVPAQGTRTFTYEVNVGPTGGGTNSVVAFLGTTQIDASANVNDNVPATATVQVAGAPDAVDDSGTTVANTPITVNVLANDTSPIGAPLVITGTTSPSNGTVVVNPDGTITYIPNAGFTGNDSFTYTITDGYGTDTATVNIAVGPVAFADSYGVARGGTLTGQNVLTNDICSTCTVTLVSDVNQGTLTLNSNGTFSYTATNAKYTTQFTYRITDSATGLTADAIATIYVSAAINDFLTTPYQTAVTYDVIANDINIQATTDLKIVSQPANGTVTIPGGQARVVNTLYTPPNGFWGLTTYVYSADAPSFQDDQATVTVLVLPPQRTRTTPHDTAYSNTLGTDTSCASCVSTLTYSVVSAPANGTLNLAADGTFSYDPAPGFIGTDTFTYQVLDPATGLRGTQTYTIKVGPLAVDDSTTTDLNTPVAINVLANDICTASCTVAVASQPANGVVTVNPVTKVATYTPANDFIGTDTFTYTITDPNSGLTSTATVTVKVLGARDDTATTPANTPVGINVLNNDSCPATATCTVTSVGTPSQGTVVINPDNTVTYTPRASFSGQATFTYTMSDGVNSSTATVTVTVLPVASDDEDFTTPDTPVVIPVRTNDSCTGCTITSVSIAPGDGTVVINNDGTVTYTPPPGFAGGFKTFTYEVTDILGNTATATVTVEVAEPPEAVDDVRTGPPNAAVVLDPRANDDCLTCTVTVATQPASGFATTRVDGQVQYIPPANFTGRVSFDYRITDPDTGLSALATITIDIEPEAGNDSAATPVDTPVNINVQANDICTSCTVTIETQSLNGTAVVEPNGTITFTPSPGYTGTTTFEYRITDPTTGLFKIATVTVVVSDALPDYVTTPFETPVSVNVLANDDCVGCTVTAAGPVPAGGSAAVDPGSGEVVFTPATGFSGLATFPYTISNGTTTASSTVTVLVAPPVLNLTTVQETPVAGSVPLTPGFCTGCVITFVSGAENGSLTLNPDGTFVYTPGDAGVTSDTFTYEVLDPATGLTVQGIVNITVDAPAPELTVTKTASAGPFVVGDQITWTVVVENTGNVTVTNLTVTDDLCSLVLQPVTDPPGDPTAPLGPGASRTFSCQTTVTQAIVNAGGVTNTAEVEGTYNGGPVTASDDATVTITRSPALSVTKTANTAFVDAAGDQIMYTMEITNSGNVTLSGITISDSICASPTVVSGSLASLAPAGVIVVNCTYTATLADISSGSIVNDFEASAPDPRNPANTISANDTVTVATSPVPSIILEKTAAPTTFDSVGDLITYTVRITNNGNATVTDVAVSDPLCTLTTTGDPSSLAPGAFIDFTCQYSATQADLDAGSVTNVATATADRPDGSSLAPVNDSVTVDALQSPSFTVNKTASPTSVSQPQSVTFTVVVTNTGNVTLRNFSVADSLCPSLTTSDSLSSLAPGGTITLTCSYNVTQADVDAGSVTNTVTVNATEPDLTPLAPVSDGATVVATRTRGLTVVKTSDVAAVSEVGDTIEFTVVVTNTGNTTLTNLLLADDLCTMTTTGSGGLAPAATRTYTCQYVVTQDDIDAGSITNVVGVRATSPTGQVGPVLDDVTVQVNAPPEISVTKTADTARLTAAGTTVEFTVAVENVGGVSLNTVEATDPLCTLVYQSGDTASDGVLSPGEIWIYTCDYVVTQANMNAGSLTNTASVTARTPLNGLVGPTTDDLVIPATQTPSFTVNKASTRTSVATAGQSVPYTVTVTNTGNVSLSNVTATDPLCTLTTSGIGDLAPGGVRVFTCTYIVTQADIDAGGIVNVASVTATDPGGGSVGPVTDGNSIPAVQAPSFTVVKDTTATSVSAVGETIPFTVTVTNSGNVTLTNLLAADSLCALASGAAGDLSPGGSRVYTCTYTVTQADLDAGSVANLATVSATTPTGTPVGPVSDGEVVPVQQLPSFTVDKTSSVSSVNAVGQMVPYTVRVTNTGNVTLSDVSASDPLCTLTTGATGGLAPGADRVFTCSYTVSQADLNAGSITNVATVSAKAPDGTTVGPVTDGTTVPALQAPAFTVDKSSTRTSVNAVGQTVPYTVTVTNTGNVTLSNVTATDPLCTLTTGATGGLAPGTTRTFSCTYVVTQADLNAGSIANLATVSAEDPQGNPTGPVTDGNTIPAVQSPALTVDKSSTTSSVSSVGQTVPYTVTVTNTGNVTLSNVTASDPLCTLTSGTSGNLTPGATRTFSCTYVVTQADLDAGGVVNLATVSATSPTGGTVGPVTDGNTIPAVQSPAFTVDKSSTTSSVSSVGQTVPYTVTVTNTGNVTLSNVTATDPLCSLSTGGSGDLAPGATRTFSCSYTVTQADLDAGSIANVASVSAQTPSGGTAGPVTDGNTVPAAQSPSFTVDKSSTRTSVNAVGQTVPYTVTVTNTGNVTLSNVSASDPLCSLTSGSSGDLAPGATRTFSCTYTVTQADLNAGSIANIASVTARTPDATPVGPVTDGNTIPAVQSPAFTVDKSSTRTSVNAVGQTVPYTVTVTNTGNVTLSNVTATDPLCTLSSGASGNLAPGVSRVFSCTYVVTQADLNAGSIANIATVNAEDPQGNPTGPVTDGNTIPAVQTPDLTVVKNTTTTSVTAAGQTVPYTVTVTNTGNVTLSNVTAIDSLCTLTSGASGDLAPGATRTFTCTYTVTQADMNAGSIANLASISATTPGGGSVGPVTDAEVVPAVASPSLIIDKTSSTTTVSTVGQVVPYTVRVTNTGNVTLSNVTVTDPLCTLTSGASGGLAPGANRVFTCSYSVTQADLNAGSIANLASVTGRTPAGALVGPTTDGNTIPAAQSPAFTVDKSSTRTSVSAVGQTVPYTVTVTNTGNVTLSNVSATDPLCTLTSGASGNLAPGASRVFSCTYAVTQADLDAGSIANIASVTALDPGGTATGPVTDGNTIPAEQTSAFTVVKSSTSTAVSAVGQSVPYTVTVTNTGNVTLSNVAASDPLCSLTETGSGNLAPGASRVFSCTYTVTQSDLDAGSIANLATVTAERPDGSPTPPVTDGNTIPATQTPGLSVAKSSTTTLVSAVGQTVPYTVTVTNTGNVTLSNVTATDSLCTLTTTGSGDLEPGASRVFTCTYTVTQTDLDAGSIANLASVSATTPGGGSTGPVTDGEVVPVVQSPGFSVVKSSNLAEVSTPGTIIVFTVTVTNTGNVTLSNITATDPLCSLTTTGSGDLAPGASRVFTCSYTVTQADIDAGGVSNTVTVNGEDPDGNPTGPVTDGNTVPAAPSPAFTVVKTSPVTEVTTVGQTVPYTVTVTNTGNVTLSNITASDPLCPLTTTGSGNLAPGASRVFTCTYTVTYDDIAAGGVSNTASVTAEDPDGNPTGPVTGGKTIPLAPVSSYDLAKTVTPSTFSSAGQVVEYSVLMTNTGNVSLLNATVSDPLCSLTPSGSGPLLPTASRLFSCSYTVTQADVDAGSLVNAAASEAVPASCVSTASLASVAEPATTGCAPVEKEAAVTIAAQQSPVVTVRKSVSPQTISAGGEMVFTVDVANAGNVTLVDTVVRDPMCNLRPVGAATAAPSNLGPGERRVYECTYRATEADAARGLITNVATVESATLAGASVVADGSASATVDAKPARPNLPSTGATVAGLAAAALVLLLGGLLLMARTRDTGDQAIG